MNQDNTAAEMTFEKAMQELEALVKQLEGSRLPLEEAIASFERGTQLKVFCEKKLADAKLRVEKIKHNQKEKQI